MAGQKTVKIKAMKPEDAAKCMKKLGKDAIKEISMAEIEALGDDRKKKMLQSFLEGSLESFQLMLCEENSMHLKLQEHLRDAELVKESDPS